MVFSELIVAYLFLGGSAAGTFLVLAAADLVRASRMRRAAAMTGAPSAGAHSGRAGQARLRRALDQGRGFRRIAYALVAATLALGGVLLCVDLGRPDAFFLLFLHPTPTYLTVGSFSLLVLLACSMCAAAESVFELPSAFGAVALACKALGCVAAAVLMVYTGLLLQGIQTVALWASPWLPALFALSALSCGLALLLGSACFAGGDSVSIAWCRVLPRADLAVVALEALVASAYVLTSGSGAAASQLQTLVAGECAPLFLGGFAACGLAVPFALECAALRFGARPGLLLATAMLMLVGGFCLRLAIVASGMHMAA